MNKLSDTVPVPVMYWDESRGHYSVPISNDVAELLLKKAAYYEQFAMELTVCEGNKYE